MDPSKTHNGRTPPPTLFFSLKSRPFPQTPHLRRRQPSLSVNPSTLGGIVVSQAPSNLTRSIRFNYRRRVRVRPRTNSRRIQLTDKFDRFVSGGYAEISRSRTSVILKIPFSNCSRIDGSTLSGKIPDMIGNWTKIGRL
ncbi:hypothetical protein RHSIM_Rhsim07G0151300 [Rhododendron simsii]|uniref:Uncharacterized protein n=1 Tax=Rhododendron simsii TaxID=118357 RepID=A0A834GUY7_RHOSS|nr:hypothetical protein RHSIM_Rhsim07G0151300 [Rhododendron simsii]